MIQLKCPPYPAKVWFTTSEEEFYRKRKAITGLTDVMGDIGACVSSSDDR